MGSCRWSAASMVAALLIFTACSGRALAGFGPSVLNGNYLVQASGSTLDDQGNQGSLALSGVITFNGGGAVTAIDVTFSAFDRNGDSENCEITGSANAALSFYSVSPNGSGTLGIGIPFNSCLDNSLTSNGKIEFNIAVAHSPAGQTRLISNGTHANLSDQSGDAINQLLLTGSLNHQ